MPDGVVIPLLGGYRRTVNDPSSVVTAFEDFLAERTEDLLRDPRNATRLRVGLALRRFVIEDAITTLLSDGNTDRLGAFLSRLQSHRAALRASSIRQSDIAVALQLLQDIAGVVA